MKKEIRSHFASCLAGRKSTGKSTFTNKCAIEFYKAHPNKRVLIIDVNGSPAYNEHQLISYDQIKRWNKGIKKFYDPDHEKMFQFIIDFFSIRNNPRGFDGLILMEDCTKYIDATPDKQMKTFLVDHRMWRADLIFTFHSIDIIPKFFWKMVNYVEIFKTQDVFEGRDRELSRRIPNYKDVLKVHEKVMKHKSDYYHESVRTLI
ncbi:MAG TPA: hypothetical protein VN026_18605 [Bacteroidia bacterium]|jgi:hypothetical protein|nr:hypothetical protein [Bacteroidia bacterium]